MLADILTRIAQKDPPLREWCVNGYEVTVWVDISFLSTDVIVEIGGSLVGNAFWLLPVHENKHINLEELVVIMRGVNLALQLKVKISSPEDKHSMSTSLGF